MAELSAEQVRRAIVEHTRRLAESAAAAGPGAAVPTTPEWTVTDPTELAVLPTDPGEWQAWLGESAQRVASDVAAALVSNHLAMLTSPAWELQRSESAHAIRGTGQTCSGLLPTPRTMRVPGSSNAGPTGRGGGPQPSGPM